MASPTRSGAQSPIRQARAHVPGARQTTLHVPHPPARESSILVTGGEKPTGANLHGENMVLKSVGGMNLEGKFATDTSHVEGPQLLERRALRPATWTEEVQTPADNGMSGSELIRQVLYERDNPVGNVAASRQSAVEGIHLSDAMLEHVHAASETDSPQRGSAHQASRMSTSPTGGGSPSRATSPTSGKDTARASRRGPRAVEEVHDVNIRRDRVMLMQKINKTLGRTHNDGGIYISIAEEQQRAKKKKYGFRQLVRDFNALPPVRRAITAVKHTRNTLSHALSLDKDMLLSLGRPDPARFAERTLGYFPRDPPHRGARGSKYYLCTIRRICIFLVDYPAYNHLVLLLVMINGVLITMVDPLESYEDVSKSPRHRHLTRSIEALNVIFCVELLVSLTAYGAYFAGPTSYLRDNWHKADMAIVLLGLLDFVSSFNSLTPLRTLKVIRPLRSLTRFAMVRDMASLVVQLVPTLGHILYLLAIMVLIFAVIGVQLWAGIFRRRCFEVHSGQRLGHRPPFYGLDRTCTLQDSINPGVFTCPEGHDCLPQVNEQPFRSFDNYYSSFMMWFQVLTLEKWSDIADRVIDGYAPASILIFVVMLLLGPFTTLKLFLATIALQLQKTHEQNKWQKAKGVVMHWRNLFMTEMLETWAYNAKLHAIKRTEACTIFVLSALLRPMKECFRAWRDFTLCEDGSEESRLAYLKRRNARSLRLQLAGDAMPIEHKVASTASAFPRI